MNEAIRNPVITARHDRPAVSAEPAGEVFTRRVITVVLAAITTLTFAFGFGNVWGEGPCQPGAERACLAAARPA